MAQAADPQTGTAGQVVDYSESYVERMRPERLVAGAV